MLVELHRALFGAVVLYALVCMVWGFGLAVRRRPNSASYRGALRLAELLILAEVIIGALTFLSGKRPPDGLHFVYGIVILLVIPAGEAFGGQWWNGRKESLVTAVGCLLAGALAVRAAMTGGLIG